MENEDGRQLLVEALVLHGVLLLLMEHRLNGSLRERLLVAHVRNTRSSEVSNLDLMCTLCRTFSTVSTPSLSSVTTFVPFRQASPSPVTPTMILIQKPEDLLGRFPFPKPIMDVVISHLRSDDLYNQVHHYPNPEHRSTALSSQAGCLYILLCHSPELLNNGYAMREIVDRFFKDSWILPVFMAYTVDLSFSWERYKAAKSSLSSTLAPAAIRDHSEGASVKDLLFDLRGLLSDGVLTQDYVMNNTQNLLSSLRNCNVTLRWLLLHRSIEGSLQTKQYLFETRMNLQEMLRTLSVQESTLATISVVSDAAYAWGIMGRFTERIHKSIEEDPFTVLKLQCLFLKLRSMLDIPLLRISQSNSADLFSVSEYYSSELVAYVCTVLEIIPDYVHVHGHRIWQEEFTQVIVRNTDKECNAYLKRRIQDLRGTYLDIKDHSMATFMGRLLQQLLRLTDLYLGPMSGWFDAGGHELIGLRSFTLLESCLGPAGMSGIDRLLSFVITRSLQHALIDLRNQLDTSFMERLATLESALAPPASIPFEGISAYKQVEASTVSFAVEGVNNAILSHIKSLSKNGSPVVALEEKQEDIKRFLGEFSKQVQLCGFHSPLQAIYITTEPTDFVALCLFLVTVSQLSRYVLDTHLGTLTSRMKKSVLDFSPLVIGFGTFLRQFHPEQMILYVQYMGQYVRAQIESISISSNISESPKRTIDATSEASKAVFWLLYFCKYMNISHDLLDSCIPPLMFNNPAG